MTLLFDGIRIDQQRRIEKEGRERLTDSIEEWRHGTWEPGSVWFGALGAAYGPPKPRKHWSEQT